MVLKSIAITCLMAIAGSVFVKSEGVEEKQIGETAGKVKMKTIAKQISTARLVRRMSIKELASALNITTAELDRIEKGEARPVKDIVFKTESILKTTFLSDEMYCASKP